MSIQDSSIVNAGQATVGEATAARPRPRVWPAILLVTLFWVFRLVHRHIELTMMIRFLTLMATSALVTLCFLVWWFVSRRTTWVERVGAFFGVIAINIMAAMAADWSIRALWVVMVPPIVLTAWALWWAVARDQKPTFRSGGLLVVLALVCGVFTLVRTDGLSGEQHVNYHWRWTPTHEQVYAASLTVPLNRTVDSTPLVLQPGDWPAFRGPRRDDTVMGSQISTDFKAHPPRQLWRQPVGPGWSSPIVVGNRVFTHEQRGGDEIVASREATTGSLVWVHADAARFDESMSGAGPRATPAFSDGKIYSLGATGILNSLDAANGKPIWTRNISKDSGSAPFMWGFASSPLISQGTVIVYAGGAKGLLGYRAEDGQPTWSANTGMQAYTSAQPAILDGKEQVLFFSDGGLIAVDPISGRVMWKYDLETHDAPRSVQPHVLSATQVLVSSETDLGTALLDLKRNNDAWQAQRTWTTRALKPSFNDYVVNDGYAYGFDGQIFCCIDLKTGKRAWREGDYGHGQVLLLVDQALLLVTSEQGEVILLKATPQGNQELGRFQALEGKTWNHPALAGNRLYLRNGQEMACFELK